MLSWAILVWTQTGIRPQQQPARFTGPFTIGRSGAALELPDHGLAAQHVALWPEEDFWYLEPVRGAIVHLNRHQLHGETLVHKGDRLVIGFSRVLLIPTTPLEHYRQHYERRTGKQPSGLSSWITA